jgi:hypothetical protein
VNLQLLQNRIAEEASRNNGEVLVSVLEKLKYVHIRTAHQDCCDCEYCVALRKYTRIKINLHHIRRRVLREDTEGFWYDMSPDKQEMVLDKLEELKQRSRTAKVEKDSFKELHI